MAQLQHRFAALKFRQLHHNNDRSNGTGLWERICISMVRLAYRTGLRRV
jgi:hypothetical protein